jgi:hypothetical protein
MALTLTQELIPDFRRGGSDNQNSNTPSQSRQSTREERSYTPTNNNTAPTLVHTIVKQW